MLSARSDHDYYSPPDRVGCVLPRRVEYMDAESRVSAKFAQSEWRYSDGKYTGLVPEIIYRFCEKYGYTAEFMDFNESNSIVMAISVGKCDPGGATISITEERKKIVDYSEPYFNNSGSIIMNGEDADSYTGVSSPDGKRILFCLTSPRPHWIRQWSVKWKTSFTIRPKPAKP